MLKQKIIEDLKTAMKTGDQETLAVLRMVTAALGNRSIEKRGKRLSEELAEEEVLNILNKELKKRRDAVDLYNKGGRPELATQEEKEAVIIQKYLPAQLSREEVEKRVGEILAQSSTRDMGSAMKIVMAELKGKADSRLISEIIKNKLD